MEDICPASDFSTASGLLQQTFCNVFQQGGLADTLLPAGLLYAGLLLAGFFAIVIMVTMLGGAKALLRSLS